MQMTVKATPERLFAEATAFMVDNGATVGARSESSVTFSAPQGISGWDRATSFGLGLFDLGAAMGYNTAMAVSNERSSTLVASPGADGESTNVTISDNQDIVDNLLRFWFLADFLREPLPNPMMAIQKGHRKMLIFNDRIEYHAGRVRKTWDIIRMEDVVAIESRKRSLTIRSRNGGEIAMKVSRNDEEQAMQIIQGRLSVYGSPPVSGDQ
jgi:hypothetical protein